MILLPKRRPIAVDLDEVLFPFIEPLVTWFNGKFGTEYRRESMHDFHLSTLGWVKPEEERDIINKFSDEANWPYFLPYPDALVALPILSRTKDIVSLSARPAEYDLATKESTERHFPGIFKRFCRGANCDRKPYGQPPTKLDIAKSLDIGLMVEDHYGNAHAFSEAGIRTYLMLRPWNEKKINSSTPKNLIPVRDWYEILDKEL